MQKIDGKRFLVIGSGAVACRKVRLLLQFSDRITVITHTGPEPDSPEPDSPEPDGPESDVPESDGPEPDDPEPGSPESDVPESDGPESDSPEPDSPEPDSPEPDSPVQAKREAGMPDGIEAAKSVTECEILREASAFTEKGVEILDRQFAEQDLMTADYCIASSDDKAENRRISELCLAAGIPVNVPDDPDLCTFFMPSVIRRGNLVVTVSTGGASPALSAELRRRIEDILPERTEEILDRMAELRTWVPDVLPLSKERGRLYADLLAALMDGTLKPSENDVRAAAEVWIRDRDRADRLYSQ